MSRANANAFAKLTPTSSAPTSPGAFVTATASIACASAAGVGERALDHRHDRREVRARRDLRHDAAEDSMHVLREDDERLQRRRRRRFPKHRGRRLVARRLDAENAHRRVRTSWPGRRSPSPAGGHEMYLHLRRLDAQAEPSRVDVDEMRQRVGRGNRDASRHHVRKLSTRCRGPLTSTRSGSRRTVTGGDGCSVSATTCTRRSHRHLAELVDSKRSVDAARLDAAHDRVDAGRAARRPCREIDDERVGRVRSDLSLDDERVREELEQLLRRAGDERVNRRRRILEHERAVEQRSELHRDEILSSVPSR